MQTGISRREVLQGLAAVGFAALQLPAAEPGSPLFFNKTDFALLDSVTEMIIPADDHSPGAHAAGVAAYIDRTVAEAFDPDEKTSWTKGLALINKMAQEKHDKPFLETAKEDQRALLESISKNERHPQTDAERFWGQLKNTTVFAYYTTDIGIHKEIGYLGNVPLDQFVGYDAT